MGKGDFFRIDVDKAKAYYRMANIRELIVISGTTVANGYICENDN